MLKYKNVLIKRTAIQFNGKSVLINNAITYWK